MKNGIINIQSVSLNCDIEQSITGYFTFRTEDVETDLKNELISKNSVAILMPYLRSEISLLTAQPETETVVLPVFNINRMMDD